MRVLTFRQNRDLKDGSRMERNEKIGASEEKSPLRFRASVAKAWAMSAVNICAKLNKEGFLHSSDGGLSS